MKKVQEARLVERDGRYYVYYRGQLMVITRDKKIALNIQKKPRESGA